MIPYTSEDYTLDECERQAEALRASGEYAHVEIRRKTPEAGQKFARVYVERKQEPITDGRFPSYWQQP